MADGTDDLVFDVAYDSWEGDHFRLVAFAYPEQFIRTVDEQAYGFLWDCRDGVVKGKVVFAGDRVDDVEFLRVAHLAEGDDAAVRYGDFPVGDDGVDVDVDDGAEALAVGAVSFGGVEGKRMGLGLLEGYAAVRVDEMLRVMPEFPGFGVKYGEGAFPRSEGRHDRTPDPCRIFLSWLHLVHHQFDEVNLVAVQGVHSDQVLDFPVDAHLGEAAAPQLVEQFAVVALAAPHQGSEEDAFDPVVFLEDQVHYLVVGIAYHLPAGNRRKCAGRLGIEQAEEIVDLGDGADRGPGVLSGGLLFYGDDGRKTGDALYFRFFQNSHKMLRVCGEGIHVPSLALRIDGVEG